MSNSTESQWYCEKCDKTFCQKQALQRHLKSKLHLEGSKSYTCEMCDFVTYDKSLYSKHCSCDAHLDRMIIMKQARMEENAEYKAKIERKNKAREDRRRAKIQKEIHDEMQAQKAQHENHKKEFIKQSEKKNEYDKKCKILKKKVKDEYMKVYNWIYYNQKDLDENNFMDEFNSEFPDGTTYIGELKLQFDMDMNDSKLLEFEIDIAIEDEQEAQMYNDATPVIDPFDSFKNNYITNSEAYDMKQELQKLRKQLHK